MDTQRSKKTRSLGANPASSRQSIPGSNLARRQDHADKHHSVPVAPRRQDEPSRAHETLKVPNKSSRLSKTTPNDDAAAQNSTIAYESYTADLRRSSAVSTNSKTQTGDKDEIRVITFAVIGNSQVGKSIFIRNALDVRRPSLTQTATSKVLLGGSLYRVQLIEVQLDSVDLSHNTVIWSSVLELDGATEVDGVLCLYDVSESSSLDRVPHLLTILDKMDKTVCLVSCKVDVPLSDHEVPSSFIDQVSRRFPKIGFEEASIDSSDSAKRCLLKILRETLAAGPIGSRLPNVVGAVSSSPPAGHGPQRPSQTAFSRSRSRSQRRKSRSQSREGNRNALPQPHSESEDESETDEETIVGSRPQPPDTKTTPTPVITATIRPRMHAEKLQTPVSSLENVSTGAQFSSERTSRIVPQTPESFAEISMLRRGSADTVDSRIYKTFLDVDSESAPDDETSAKAGSPGSPSGSGTADGPYQGSSFTDLVDRLLTAPVSRADHKFVSSFLCLYRVFATPMSLLRAIIDRFMKTEQSDMIVFSKTAELLRYLSVLELWTAKYPGDFAGGAIKDLAASFVERSKSFAPAAKQIANNLQTHVPDEDKDWAFSDSDGAARSKRSTLSHQSQARSSLAHDAKGYRKSASKTEGNEENESDEDIKVPSSARHSAATSSALSSSKGSQVSSQASDNIHDLDRARESARRLRIMPQKLVGKLEWRLFMDFSEEELATEMTRMDWTMYTAIRPRDFVRYVIVSNTQRPRPGHDDYIGMMIKHFNHLALFVSGMILVRDKPKHRAEIVRRIMDLAWKVRQLNNYHALGAIVAALSGEEIMRLTQTHELVGQDKHKQFLRLKILMGHQKSHAAYRMAWENSSAARIPYLPRIQEDLTKAAQGNPTFLNDEKMINWKKFEIMGDTIISIQKSQEQPYSFPERTVRGHDIDRLILQTKILEGEDGFDPQQELYERSKLVEPPTTGGSGAEKKKFDWLRR